MLLDHPAQRARTHLLIIAFICQPFGGGFSDFDRDMPVHQLRFKLQNKLFNNLHGDGFRQWCKAYHSVQTVAKFWGKLPFNRGGVFALAAVAVKSDRRFRLLSCTGIRGHNQNHIAKINRAAIMVCESAVIHHLQQHIIHIGMGFFDLIQQQNAMWVLVNPVCQLPALIKSNIARRRADQPADRVFFHIFGHVKAQHFHAKTIGQLLGNFCFPNTGWAGE